MWESLIVEPILNCLSLIYALIPGHSFGLAIIVLTIIIRLAFWPIVKKQIRHSRALRDIQPEVRKIKKQAAGNRQQEYLALHALYRQRQINLFAPIGYLLLQLPIFIGIYQVVSRIGKDAMATLSSDSIYGFVGNLDWMKQIAAGSQQFSGNFLGIDLTSRAWSSDGWILGATILALIGAAAQYYTTKQLMQFQQPPGPDEHKGKKLRQLLAEQQQGKDIDQAVINQRLSRVLLYFFPGIILIFSLRLVAALPFYWLFNNIITYIQQRAAYKRLAQLQPDQPETITTNSKGRRVVKATVLDSKTDKPLNAKQKRLQKQ